MAKKQKHGKSNKCLERSARNKLSGKYVRQRRRTEANKAQRREVNRAQ